MSRKKRDKWGGPKGATFEEYMAWLAKQPRPPFKPYAWYCGTGDIIHVGWKDCDYYAEWLNHQVTLLRDQETKEVIGVQVWAIDDDGKNGRVSRVVRREAARDSRRSAAWKRQDAAKAAKLIQKIAKAEAAVDPT